MTTTAVNGSDFFKWLDIYDTGIPVIDGQHKELVRILNRLHLAITNKEGAGAIKDIFDAMADYTIRHFDFEEKLQIRAKYDGYDEHIKLHATLLQQVKDLQKRFATGDEKVYHDAMKFLCEWLRSHIMKCDRGYVPAMQRAGLDKLPVDLLDADAPSGNKKNWWKIW